METRKRVLWVEDEADIRTLVTLHLHREGFEPIEAASGSEAIQLLKTRIFDLAILDWMLPDVNGLELLKKIKSDPKHENTPVLMLTARSDTQDIVRGLDLGADDYLTKPFSHSVLLARVRALLRRTPDPHPSAVLTDGPINMDLETYQVTIDQKPIHLTRSEFKLLQSLMSHSGKVLTRQELIQQVQGEGISVIDRAIDTQIFGLRKKLTPHETCIETIRGVGYRFKLS